MRQTRVATIFALLLAAPALHAQQTSPADVISDQIAAFQRDDFAAAFSYASPMIRGLFGTPERFGRMVREGYPMVHRPAKIDFLGTEDMGGVMKQRVMIRDAAGALHVLEYEMIQAGDAWQINGVRPVEVPRALS